MIYYIEIPSKMRPVRAWYISPRLYDRVIQSSILHIHHASIQQLSNGAIAIDKTPGFRVSVRNLGRKLRIEVQLPARAPNRRGEYTFGDDPFLLHDVPQADVLPPERSIHVYR
jgi:hypothetical protein